MPSFTGWSRGIKVVDCENEGIVKFPMEAVKLLGGGDGPVFD